MFLPSDESHARELALPKCTLVCGPAGSGKSAYVAERIERGDILVDFDYLTAALSGLLLLRDRDGKPPSVHEDEPACLLPFVSEARDAVVARLYSRLSRVRSAWLIMTGATRQERRRYADPLRAQVVVLAVPEEECIRRLEASGRPHLEEHRAAIREWWARYEPEPGR